MKMLKKIDNDYLAYDIKNYAREAVLAIEQFTDKSCKILNSTEIEVKNYIENNLIITLMNIKEIYFKSVNTQYALTYFAISENEIIPFSNMVFKKNNIESNDYSLRLSSLKECSNRIGARLLNFPKKEKYFYDIGTPVILPKFEGGAGDSSIVKIWPLCFYSQKLLLDNITIEFGCTMIESETQRIDKLFDFIGNKLRGTCEMKHEKESKLDELSSIFNVHFIVKLLTEETAIISLPMKYNADIMFFLNTQSRKSEDIKKDFEAKLNLINIFSEISIIEGSIPEEYKSFKTKVVRFIQSNGSCFMAISVPSIF